MLMCALSKQFPVDMCTVKAVSCWCVHCQSSFLLMCTLSKQFPVSRVGINGWLAGECHCYLPLVTS